jgi:hypothetical protein
VESSSLMQQRNKYTSLLYSLYARCRPICLHVLNGEDFIKFSVDVTFNLHKEKYSTSCRNKYDIKHTGIVCTDQLILRSIVLEKLIVAHLIKKSRLL